MYLGRQVAELKHNIKNHLKQPIIITIIATIIITIRWVLPIFPLQVL